MIRFVLASLLAMPFMIQAQTTPPTCAASNLTGTYYLTMTGRNLNASTALSASYQAVGTATFDGKSNVSFTLTANTNILQGTTQALSGTYTLAASCIGTLSLTTGDTANFTLIAWNSGKNFDIVGQDATYVLTGTGGQQPPACTTSLLSGAYVFSGNGFSLSSTNVGGTNISGVNSVSGLLQFDGRGDVTGNWTIATNGTSSPDTVSGKYTINSCQATATVTDPAGTSWTLTLTMTSTDGANFTVDGGAPLMQFSAAAHSTFTNPGLAVANSASSVGGGTPPGSIFALYGQNLAPSSASATKVPLPTTLGSGGTTVTVHGQQVPLFFVSQGQINAQMPWETPPGLVDVVVTNASGMSNTAAVTVPATAVPGVFPQYPGNQAVVADINNNLITAINPAHVGDIVVAYFTGGGPVTPAGPVVTGAFSPNGISPVTATSYSVAVAGVPATTVNYVGLTGSLVGVYQANFVVPKVATGTRDLVITIAGKASVVTTMSVAQ
ncbi:MAG TPA: hypothetical protein VK789_17800 [Bryobacteraceae bacterium]|nr:hypothetical protein [Bryobacteraceae bacterium]